jgi:ubiquinone/menaquinone biosynthesis C-methylase UbiE
MDDRPEGAVQTFWSEFGCVDHSDDPQSLIRFLDDFAELPPVRAAKLHSLRLLGIAQGSSVLDVGCGVGAEVLELARIIGPTGRAAGVDSSETVVAQARSRARRAALDVEYEVAEATALPYPDGTFDGCRGDRVLQHLDEPEAALREMIRVSRAGARVVITESTHSLVGEPAGLDLALTEQVFAAFAPSRPQRGWAAYFLPVLMRRAGLIDVAVKVDGGAIGAPAVDLAALPLGDAVERLVASGAATPARANAWMRRLSETWQSGELKLDVRLFHFVGWVR